MRNIFILLLALVGILAVWEFSSKFIPAISKPQDLIPKETLKITQEQNVVIDVVNDVGPSVVTIGVESLPLSENFKVGPFSVFFGSPPSDSSQEKDKFIGSGFIVSQDGLIVTNKHVVSDRTFKYIAVDSKGKKYAVDKIYRDPLNDIAILKVSAQNGQKFKQVKLGNSDKLQVGQFAIAIGTALGEFRNTVTTGVISGLGRGITAGNPFEGFAERLDNVIQTDAAINPGNSGGPLLNSSGEVIGVNSAVASEGQNIGFAIPINVVKESIKNFNQTGQFNRAYLGISYVMISKNAAVLNDLPEGAYVRGVADGSPAQKAGISENDIITKIDGEKLSDKDGGLANIISTKKVGDAITLTYFREGQTRDTKVTLTQSP